MNKWKIALTLLMVSQVHSQPYVGEIRVFGSNFCPAGWAELDGALLSISENETLFQLIGTTYGGDGQETFALPDQRGRIAVGQGNGKVVGEMAGTENVTLSTNQLPAHTHAALNVDPIIRVPVADSLTATPTTQFYLGTASVDTYVDTSFSASPALKGVTVKGVIGAQVQPAGGSQPFSIIPPRLGMIHCISLYGIFPSPT